MNKKKNEGSNKKMVSESEALKILNFEDLDEIKKELIIERFTDYFERNDPEKGGSAYIRAKVVNAKDSLVKAKGWNLNEIDKEIASSLEQDSKKPEENKDPEPSDKDVKEEEELEKKEEKEEAKK